MTFKSVGESDHRERREKVEKVEKAEKEEKVEKVEEHVEAGMELSPPICRLSAAPLGLGRRFPTHSKYSQFSKLQISSFFERLKFSQIEKLQKLSSSVSVD